jgi:hypothetical protein
VIAAEKRARAWYAQHIGRTGSWNELTEDRRQQFIRTAGRESTGRCAAPECGGDCLECFDPRPTDLFAARGEGE